MPEFVILDEIQLAPSLFTAIKASVDNNRKSGRFILTGSSNVLLIPKLADSLAGRMEIIHLKPLAQAEIASQKPNLLEQLFSGELSNTLTSKTYSNLGKELASIICKGGYPAALQRDSEKRRTRWYQDYITTLIQRDVQDIANIKNLDILPRLLSFTATQTAQLFNVSELASPFSLSLPTIKEYLTLLENVFLIEKLTPWHSNRLSRLIKTPKIHLADTGLASSLLGVTSKHLWEDKKLLGQLLETFIYQELKKHADWYDLPLNFYHFRNKDKVEVDIIIESGMSIVGVEVKASATITSSDFKGLRKLQDSITERFTCGIVFYDGERILSFGNKLYAVPISVLI